MRKIVILLVIVSGISVAALYYHSSTPRARLSSQALKLIQNTPPMSWSPNERLISTMRDKLRNEPDNPDANSSLGHAYLQRARETGDPALYGQAEELFDKVLARYADHVDAIVGKASLAMSRHEFKEARRFAERAILLNPDASGPYGMLTDALTELGEYDDAIHAAETMTSLKPNLSSYSRISYLRELMGDAAGAEQAMRMAIEAGAPDTENTAWCIVQLGNLYLNSSRPVQAEMAFRAALRRFPNYVHAYAGLARVFAARKQFELAVTNYKKAIDRVPMPEFLIGLGEVYQRMGNEADAKAQFDLVAAIQDIYRSNGVVMDADMALFQADHGVNVSEAVSMAKAEWNRRKSIKVADIYAWSLYRAGRNDEASRTIEQALRLGTKDPLFLYHAGMIAEAVGDHAMAKTDIEEALRLNPGFSAVHAREAENMLLKLNQQASR